MEVVEGGVYMPLSDEERQKLLHWLRKKGGQQPSNCPVCGKVGYWDVGDVIVAPRFEASGEIQDHQKDAKDVVPMVQLVCMNCGYIRLFAATAMGIRTPSQ